MLTVFPRILCLYFLPFCCTLLALFSHHSPFSNALNDYLLYMNKKKSFLKVYKFLAWNVNLKYNYWKKERNQVRKSPKSDIKLACFDILWYLWCFNVFLPNFLLLQIVCPDKNQIEGIVKHSKLCAQKMSHTKKKFPPSKIFLQCRLSTWNMRILLVNFSLLGFFQLFVFLY